MSKDITSGELFQDDVFILLGDEKFDYDPEVVLSPEIVDAVSLQGLGRYDNIGLFFDKNSIKDYIRDYPSISRTLSFSVLHNSGTAAKYDKGLATVKSFNSYHLSKGWKCIGYHWVICADGTIYAARKMEYIGAHAGSKGNPGSIGICLVGNFETSDKPTQAQKESLAALHSALHERFYGNASLTIRFHREFMATGCPGDITVPEVMSWMKEDEKLEEPEYPIANIIVDGVNIGNAVLIDDVSYVKPRDFEKAGYFVGWDAATKTIILNKPEDNVN